MRYDMHYPEYWSIYGISPPTSPGPAARVGGTQWTMHVICDQHKKSKHVDALCDGRCHV